MVERRAKENIGRISGSAIRTKRKIELFFFLLQRRFVFVLQAEAAKEHVDE